MTRLFFALAFASAFACGEETIGQRVDRHIEDAKQASIDAANQAVDATKDAAVDAKDWVVEKHESGELSDMALSGLKTAGDGIAHVASKGKQLAPVALEIGKVLYTVVDKDIDIDPIFQEVDDADAQASLDKSIHDMGRVETIEGVEVGFKSLTDTNADKRVSESAYLVLWRHEDRLVGFVYRSKSEIDLDTLVKEAPRLFALVEGAIEE